MRKYIILSLFLLPIFYNVCTEELSQATQDLFNAIEIDGLKSAKQALKSGADLYGKNEFFRTPVQWALQKNSKKVLMLLIVIGAHRKDENGETILHRAVRDGALTIVKLCVAMKIDLNSLNNNQQTPLNIAIDFERELLIDMLADAGAKTAFEILSKLKNEDFSV